jgi:DNA repair exonuclease SbcCD nuclease subunit
MKLNNIRKINIVGDLHLGIKNNSVEWLEIQKDFLLDFLVKSVDADFDEDRDILILEGDIFHSRESINVRIQNEAFSIFKKLAEKFKRGIYIIVGNHAL